jgi:alpha-amylase
MSLLGSFSENHDQPRFASLNDDIAAASNVITYTMLADGIPIIYQGQEQHYKALGDRSDPYNREALWLSNFNTDAQLYKLITKLNTARKIAIADDGSYLASQNNPIYTDMTTIALRKGKMVTVLSNRGSRGASYTQYITSGYNAGTQVTELLTCSTLTSDSSGHLKVPMYAGEPRIYYPSKNIGSVCGRPARPKRSRISL